MAEAGALFALWQWAHAGPHMQSAMCTELFFKDKTMTLSAVQAQTRAANISGASPADRQAAGFCRRPGKICQATRRANAQPGQSNSTRCPPGAAHPGYLAQRWRHRDLRCRRRPDGAGYRCLLHPAAPRRAGGFEHPAVVDAHRNNLRALSQHIAKRLPDALKAYGIPSAPAYVRYDSMGQPVLPDNYPMPTSSRPCSTNSQRCRGS